MMKASDILLETHNFNTVILINSILLNILFFEITINQTLCVNAVISKLGI